MSSLPSRFLSPALIASALLLAASCTSGGGEGDSFTIQAIGVSEGQVWKINRPIEITFNEAVDFSSVNLNTINIRKVGGGPSAGEFYLSAPNVVVFQPRCPMLDDLSDAGLEPGGVTYELNILGVDKTSSLTVVSVAGVSLATGDSRRFVTPISTLPQDLFFDPQPLWPVPVVRSVGSTDPNATYLEIGDDPSNRVYFERDLLGAITLNPPGALPLNLLSDPGSHVALMLFFNQPVDASSSNVNATNLEWQFESAVNQWSSLGTSVDLLANCTQTGALVRIEPTGILPPSAGAPPNATNLRVVVKAEFSDIVGETNQIDQDDFAPAITDVAPPPLADQMLEEFATTEQEDAGAALSEPFAEWGGGALKPNFSFSGTGGPGGDFDWKVAQGQDFLFSTESQFITGGPNFSNSIPLTVIGGVLDVNDLRIEAGARLKIQGSNPMVILASGTVEILGEINVSGGDALGVTTLNTANIPETGAPGQGGGGKGGTGSPLTTASDPKGGNGFGAFGQPDAGGQGGETGWNNAGLTQLDGRRGSGGGGGVFAANQPIWGNFGPNGPTPNPSLWGDWDQTYLGLDAEKGFDNPDPGANGAITGTAGPIGGSPGPGPFGDASASNDFFGSAVDLATNLVIVGELKTPWAGAGGGGGGDASFVGIGGTFPKTPYDPKGDEKGAGAAGGAGGLRIQALDDIVFGQNGLIVCRGGSGGGGENTLFLNRLGGGSGGGSGGHVILESAGVINFQSSAGNSATAGKLAGGIIATGGQGGAGKSDVGGAMAGPNGKVETAPNFDACPKTSLGGNYTTFCSPPGTGNCTSPIFNQCQDATDGAGGDGGPGIIQLHVGNPATDIILPASGLLTDVCKPAPFGRYFFNSGTTTVPVRAEKWNLRLVPTFGPRSISRSKWIGMGEGGFLFGQTNKDVALEFGGTSTATGLVQTSNGMVVPLPPILTGTLQSPGGGVPPFIGTDGFTVVLDATPLLPPSANAYLLESPQLLQRYLVQLQASPSLIERFNVVAASLNPANNRLTLTMDPAGGPLSPKFGPGDALELQPAFFRITTNGTADELPPEASVRVAFQVTTADASGQPDDPAGNFPAGTTFTPDVGQINANAANPDFRFMRFEVEFNIDVLGNGLSPQSPIPSVDFLRIPFRY